MYRAKLYFALEKPCILSEVTQPLDHSFKISQEMVHDDHMITFLINTEEFTAPIERQLVQSKQIEEVERVDDERLLVTKRSCGALPIIRQNHGKLQGMDRINGSQRIFDILVFRREDLKKIIEELNGMGTVHLGYLSQYGRSRGNLSQRQSEVIELALEEGYFEWPREIGSEKLADKLGIANSTFLEHLRKAERKLLVEALDLGNEPAAPPRERAFMLEETKPQA